MKHEKYDDTEIRNSIDGIWLVLFIAALFFVVFLFCIPTIIKQESCPSGYHQEWKCLEETDGLYYCDIHKNPTEKCITENLGDCFCGDYPCECYKVEVECLRGQYECMRDD